MTRLVEATEKDCDLIVGFLTAMIPEVGEFPPEAVTDVPISVRRSFSENVQWFLFMDEDGQPFGTCFCQPVCSYWQTTRRYCLGAFYIAPSHRGQNRVPEICRQLRQWATDHNGTQIFCTILDENGRSRKAFEKAGYLSADELVVYMDRWEA